MSRFRERLAKADARINRAFAEEVPACLQMGEGPRLVTVIFESPDALSGVPGGGEIQNHTPAFSAMTADLSGLEKHDGVVSNTIQIGRASWRERVCQNVERAVGARRF